MLLGVTQRTLSNWERGRARVSYSAYELLRILGGYALPGKAWAGWSIRGDALYSPEGLAFRAHEAAYWSLTCSMARDWQRQYYEAASPSSCKQAAQGCAPLSRDGRLTGVGAAGPPAAPAPSAPLFAPVSGWGCAGTVTPAHAPTGWSPRRD